MTSVARRVVFRADASIEIGAGHVMRCLVLADILRARGAECRFVCRDHPGAMAAEIRARGFEVAVLPREAGCAAAAAGHGHWLGAQWSRDAEQTWEVLADTVADWLVVDHYALDARWESRLRRSCRRILVIDDLADRPHDCDILVDQTLGRRAVDYFHRVPAWCRILTGTHYALLRAEFAALREASLERRATAPVRHILVSMGAFDLPDATGRVLRTLRDGTLPRAARITVVLSESAPALAGVRALAAEQPGQIRIAANPGDMAALMADSDIAIGAAGTTAWERCCLGLPSLLVVLAENQRRSAGALAAAGAARLLGEIGAIEAELPQALAWLQQPARLRTMQQKARRLVDGGGAGRLADLLFC